MDPLQGCRVIFGQSWYQAHEVFLWEVFLELSVAVNEPETNTDADDSYRGPWTSATDSVHEDVQKLGVKIDLHVHTRVSTGSMYSKIRNV